VRRSGPSRVGIYCGCYRAYRCLIEIVSIYALSKYRGFCSPGDMVQDVFWSGWDAGGLGY
jgi:hypothetical protein